MTQPEFDKRNKTAIQETESEVTTRHFVTHTLRSIKKGKKKTQKTGRRKYTEQIERYTDYAVTEGAHSKPGFPSALGGRMS